MPGCLLAGGLLALELAVARSGHVRPADFSAYNGFPVEELPAELLPPVLDGINGLQIQVDGTMLKNAQCTAQDGRLLILAEMLKTANALVLSVMPILSIVRP